MSKVTLKRTYYRTVCVLILFEIFSVLFKSALKPISSLSLFNILVQEKSVQYLTDGVVSDLLLFCATLIFLHLIWAYIITIHCSVPFRKLTVDNHKTQCWLIILLIHFNLILVANSYWFPTSLLSIYRHAHFTSSMLITSIFTLLVIWYFISLIQLRKVKTCLASIAIAIFVLYPVQYPIEQSTGANVSNPNVFLIGIDALRPDHLHYMNNQQPDYLPYLNNFLSSALIYQDTYTPLPRTFVSWISLLKSQYPNTHGGRFNLTAPHIIDKHIPLIEDLKKRDYVSSYAIDERRFNQIDQTYGFEQIIGPKIGFADQLTNRIADLPILNLLSHTRFGKHFLPFMYLNRANGKVYDPIQFNKAALSKLSATRPNFFSIHFCMQHWPYTSKNFINIDKHFWQGNYNHFMYLSLLEQVDAQFQHFMETLKEKGYLDDAIVYVFSDHGDGFLLEQDTISAKDKHDARLKLTVNSWGHGTNALDQTQANVLLSKVQYRNAKPINSPSIIQGNFSLIDIMPTLYKDLDLKTNSSFQGQVLPKQNKQDLKSRFVFVNSSKPSKALDTSFIKNDDVMYENMDVYEVNKEGQLIMTMDAFEDIKQKQHRSVYYNQKQLAYIPSYGGFIGVNLPEKQWQPITQFNQDTDWYKMLNAFCNHYISADPDLIFKECESLNSTAFKQSLTKESLN